GIDELEGKRSGGVSAFSIAATGKQALINQRQSMGPSPCHLALDGEARNLLVTNCGDGSVAVLPVAADGKLGDATEVVKGAGATSVALDLQRKHAPPIYERGHLKEFGGLRPLDDLQGAVTHMVRCGYTPLGNGKFAMALGDIHILNGPIIAQGANAASRCAWLLGEALLQDRHLDETFCRETEQQLWEAGRAATEWTNMTLLPPPPYVIELFMAAAQNKALADELTENFNAPERNWEIFSNPEGAAAFLMKHTSC